MPHDGRTMHLLSDLETRLTLELRWADDVTDVREQVPIPLEYSLAIAEDMGVSHPIIPGDVAPVVMTTDFVFVLDAHKHPLVCARAVKGALEFDLRNTAKATKANDLYRMLELLEIERRYWQGQGADWRLVSDLDLDRVRAANIQLLLSWEGLDRERGPVFWQDALDLSISTLRQSDDRSLGEIGSNLERAGKLTQRQFMDCVRHMCATRQLEFDMSEHFAPERRACDFSLRVQ